MLFRGESVSPYSCLMSIFFSYFSGNAINLKIMYFSYIELLIKGFTINFVRRHVEHSQMCL